MSTLGLGVACWAVLPTARRPLPTSFLSILTGLILFVSSCAKPEVQYVKPLAQPGEYDRVNSICQSYSDPRPCMEHYGWHQDKGGLDRLKKTNALALLKDGCDAIDRDPGSHCLYMRRSDAPLGEDNLRLAVFFETPAAAERNQDKFYGAALFFCSFAAAAQEEDTADLLYTVGKPPNAVTGHERCDSLNRDENDQARLHSNRNSTTWCRLTHLCEPLQDQP